MLELHLQACLVIEEAQGSVDSGRLGLHLWKVVKLERSM